MNAARNVVIPARFCGPPSSANGGYVSGLLAAEIAGTAEITLRAPPPLDTPLQLRRGDDGAVSLHDGPTLLAEGRPVTLELALPTAVSLAEAEQARARFHSFGFDRCFVCGRERVDDGGLLIHPGVVQGRSLVASPWLPAADLLRGAQVDPLFVWSALDCPSWFAHAAFCAPERLRFALLGRMTAQVSRAPERNEPCVVVGWGLSQEGRRIHSASALFGAEGEPLAWSRATWIELK